MEVHKQSQKDAQAQQQHTPVVLGYDGGFDVGKLSVGMYWDLPSAHWFHKYADPIDAGARVTIEGGQGGHAHKSHSNM